jgi:hypothetical protein
MSATLVPRVYAYFRGVDFRGDEIDLARSPDSLNVWKDYKEIDSIRTRPGMKSLVDFSETVFGIFFYNNMTLVHSGTKLYKIVNGVKEELYSGLNTARSNSFIFNNIWYFKDGANYLQYDGQNIGEVEGYIPTTSIGRKPSGGGTIHEDVNMLSDWRINTFIGDGESTSFYLDSPNVEEVSEVQINGETVTGWSCVAEEGKVIFSSAPPFTDGQDNVSIKFKKSIGNDVRNKINNCTLLQVFDNRVFFSGNSNYPNTIWHSSLNDPSYCSDLDYYDEGLDYAKVKGMVAGNNVLWVFKEPSQANTTVFYHTPTIDSEYGKIYPNTHSSISTGCVGKAINFNDDIIFFSDRGMEGINGDITTEQVIAHRSSLVDRKLIAESNYEDMILEEWEGYLVVIIDNKVYLADSRAVFTNEDHIEYEWYYWELDKKITCAKVNKGILYLGTEDGVYTMTDTESDVESYWVTPKDKFMYPQYMKTTNKKGCVAEATGDISVYAKTDKTGFELISTHKDITDKFVCRIKRKKFKDIQLKFHSSTRFTLESCSLECFVGGYLKR